MTCKDCETILKAFNILMEYWDELSPDSKIEADKKLKEIGM